MLNSQPQNGLVEIDWDNPITRGLVFAYIPGVGDITRHVKTVANPRGAAGRLGMHTAPLNAAPFPEFGVRKIVGTPFSVVVVGTFASAASFTAPILSQFGGNGGWKFGVNSSGNIGYTHYGVADYNTAVAISGFSGSIGMTGGASTSARFFKGGEFREALAVGGISAVGSDGNYSIGSRATSSDALSASTVALVLCFERALTDTEHASLAANPWQVVIDQDEEDELLYSQVAATGGVNGTGSITFGSISGASAGTATVSAASNSTLGGIATSGAIAARSSGTSATTLGAVSAAGMAAALVSAASATSLNALPVASAGTTTTVGSGAIAIGQLSTAAAGGAQVSVASSSTFDGLSVSGAGTSPSAGANGSASITLGALSASSAGAAPAAAAAEINLSGIAIAASGGAPAAASASQTLGAVSISGAGLVGSANPPIAGASATTIGALVASSAGGIQIAAQGATTAAPLSILASGGPLSVASAQIMLGGLVAVISGSVGGEAVVYARAPDGAGYSPQRASDQSRPTAAATRRPSAIQRNHR